MAFNKQAQTLAVEAVAGVLTGARLTQATSGSTRYLAALTAVPSGADPSTISEGAGTSLRPPIVWSATNLGATPVEVSNNGDIYIGPFSANYTITHIALVTTSSTITTGTVLSVVAITSRNVTNGDRLRFASGTVKVTTT
jgi:hypothetical protein